MRPRNVEGLRGGINMMIIYFSLILVIGGIMLGYEAREDAEFNKESEDENNP